MSAYGNQVKTYIERYKAEMGGDALLDPHAVAAWAYENGLHRPSVRTVVDIIAQDIAQLFREEYRTNEDGQRYPRSMRSASRRASAPCLCGLTSTTTRLPETISFGLSRNDASR